MPIDEGVNIDLQFLILEVKKQARASLSCIERPSLAKIGKVRVREDYVDNLKNTLENKSYFNIHQNVEDEKQMNYFRALITIGANLERCADFFEHIAEEMEHVNEPETFHEFDLRRYYSTIYRALDLIYPAFMDSDLDLAQKICDYEQDIDELYENSYARIRSNLKRRRHVDDMLSLLTIVRYLERVGDSFLNIGEAILDIRVGEKMGIKQFRHLKQGLESQGLDINDAEVLFKPIMNTRSGSRVAQISGPEQNKVFYKEGPKSKIDEEVNGIKLWQKKFPGWTPEVLWHNSRRNHATVLLEYIDGTDLLEILINSRSKLDHALDLLSGNLVTVWDTSRKKKTTRVDYISQLMQRKGDIQSVHSNLFDRDDDLDELLADARKLEKDLKVPFTTLIHGDFNVDNIIFQLKNNRMFYVDVHRSGYGDYVQDVSVFLVSNFRIPIFSRDIRQRLNEANRRVYRCAADYAEANNDSQFDERLAIGLFRSLITSTRFMFDKNFSHDMYERALLILRELLAHRNRYKRKQFKLREDYFLYG